jgi:hypothetical protein
VTNSSLICSFCGEEPKEVVLLVNAVSVSVKDQQTAGANECVELCAQLIGSQSRNGSNDIASLSPRSESNSRCRLLADTVAKVESCFSPNFR